MIQDYQFGSIKIDGKVYTADVIIRKDSVEPDWWRKDGHKLSLDDLTSVLKEKLEVLIIGTGAQGVMQVSDNVKAKIESLGIILIVKKTKEACEEYNKLYENKTTIAALHLTC